MNNVVFFCLLAVVALSACSTSSRQGDITSRDRDYDQRGRLIDHESAYVGRVSNINVVQAAPHTSGGGAAIGAVVGGVIGNQLGHGDGRAAATAAGAVGGAMVGNAVEKHHRQRRDVFRVTVNFDNGHRAQFDYAVIGDLRVGDRVRIDNGQLNRINH